jgi:hypothetical protein
VAAKSPVITKLMLTRGVVRADLALPGTVAPELLSRH